MKAKLVQFNLNRIYRQKDRYESNLLCRIRTGTQTDSDLEYLSKHVQSVPPMDATILSVFNADVDKRNLLMLGQVKGDEHVFEARRTGSFKKKDKQGNYKKDGPYQESITLRIGCRVIIKQNGSYETPKREWDGVDSRTVEYVNGDSGTYLGLDPKEKLIIRLDSIGRTIRLGRTRAEDIRYVRRDVVVRREDPETLEQIEVEESVSEKSSDGTYEQYPAVLGYAQTIASAQGQTLDKVHVNLPPVDWMRKMKPEGLIYVAMSRVKELKNLSLSRKLTSDDIYSRIRLDSEEEEQYSFLI